MKTVQVTFSVHHGDALEYLKTLESDSVDALICDPPSGIAFMNKGWDTDKGGVFEWVRWLYLIMEEAYRVLKPGAHGLVWAIPRTSHWTGMALEVAGFDIRDRIHHIFGTGMPKNTDLSKTIDKRLGKFEEREVVGYQKLTGNAATPIKDKGGTYAVGAENTPTKENPITAPASDEAKDWDGWGTALKPAVEDWWLVRKPPKGSITSNVLEYGVGGINIGANFVGYQSEDDLALTHKKNPGKDETFESGVYGENRPQQKVNNQGRWPPHLLMSHSPLCDEEACCFSCPIYHLNQQSGTKKSAVSKGKGPYPSNGVTGFIKGHSGPHNQHGDEGGASRFFPTFLYTGKPSPQERDAGLEDMPLRSAKKWNPGGIQGRRDKKANEAIADAQVHSQGLDARGRTLIREDGTETLVARFIPQHRANIHPTVKSIDFMRWLCRLITPPGGTIVDPFTGSGTTGCAAVVEGFNFLGSELDEENEGFVEIAMKRMAFWAEFAGSGETTKDILKIRKREEKVKDSRQKTLF